jgi:hypothetical protein
MPARVLRAGPGAAPGWFWSRWVFLHGIEQNPAVPPAVSTQASRRR